MNRIDGPAGKPKKNNSQNIRPEKLDVTGEMARADWESAYLRIRALALRHGLDAKLVELRPAEQEKP